MFVIDGDFVIWYLKFVVVFCVRSLGSLFDLSWNFYYNLRVWFV